MRQFPLFFFYFLVQVCVAQKANTFYEEALLYYSPVSDSLTIDEIIPKVEEGIFKKEEDPRVYKNLGTNTLWYYTKIYPDKNERHYLTIDFSFLDYGQVYLKTNKGIDSLHQVSFNKEFAHHYFFYKDPVWVIPSSPNSVTEVFIELRNNPGRARLNILLEAEDNFLKRIEKEYTFFGLFIAFLVSMTIILVFFSVLKKEYVVLFYASYIVVSLIEFLAGKGLGVQFFWSKSPFLVENIRGMCHLVSTFSIGMFYYKFYKLKGDEKIVKGIFKISALLAIPLFLLYLYKYFFSGLTNLTFYVQVISLFITFSWVLNHVYLSFKKHIPLYLALTFILPAAAIVIGQTTNPGVTNDLWIVFSGPNLYYVFLIVEIIVFTRFIFSSVIESQQKYTRLKKVSDELKYNFQNKALEVQHQERNKLVSDVHDTFGGYIEALKLRLLHKTENNFDKIQEILDAFSNDYRYLLNSLYAPKINADNFKLSIDEFSTKLSSLTDYDISCQIDMGEVILSQEKYINLYRIISELTTNSIKYANGSKITIEVNLVNKKMVVLLVKDNGVGFDQTEVKNKGFGLSNIRERVEQINGEMELDSNSNGTRVEIKFFVNG